MDKAFSRAVPLLGESAYKKLNSCRIAVFGLGGVGGYCLEALARSGVGAFDIVDNDVIEESNINRQLFALRSTVGQLKTHVAAERLKDINPSVDVEEYPVFYTDESAAMFDFSRYDYIVDAVDTVAAKVSLAVRAQAAGVKIISCMGTGNKLDPSKLEICDIFSTSVCPLARVMRSRLKKAGVKALKVVSSCEVPLTASENLPVRASGHHVPASCAFVPSVAGLLMASEVVKDILALQ